jgi:glycosyltransferase involved in cell wall biosynthesis
VIDDGSRDATGAILDDLAKSHPYKMRVIHTPNRGHGPALWQGLNSANADWILLVDADNQIELDHFIDFWENRIQADIIIGNRLSRFDPPLRIWLSNLIRFFINFYFGEKIADANVPFKLFKHFLWEKVKKRIPADTLAPSLFLAVAAKRLGYKMVEYKVRHYPRRTGKGSLRSWQLLPFCFKAFQQLLKLKACLQKP